VTSNQVISYQLLEKDYNLFQNRKVNINVILSKAKNLVFPIVETLIALSVTENKGFERVLTGNVTGKILSFPPFSARGDLFRIY
jgi:hypothetical protein